MKPAFIKSAFRLTVISLVLVLTGAARAQDPQASPSPMDEKARQRAEREAKKAAEQEEKALKAAAEKERKEAEAAAKEREKATARLIAAEEKGKGAGSEPKDTTADKQAPTPAATPTEALTKEQERIRKAEEKARLEAEKARQKEEERARAQEAKDAERRRKDEERAGREAAKAREAEDKAPGRGPPERAGAGREGRPREPRCRPRLHHVDPAGARRSAAPGGKRRTSKQG